MILLFKVLACFLTETYLHLLSLEYKCDKQCYKYLNIYSFLLYSNIVLLDFSTLLNILKSVFPFFLKIVCLYLTKFIERYVIRLFNLQ